MKIRPSTALRNEYNEISEYCKREGKPVFITKNGEGDLVVMSIEAYEEFEAREQAHYIREKLLEAEAELQAGAPTYTLEEVMKHMEDIINNAQK